MSLRTEISRDLSAREAMRQRAGTDRSAPEFTAAVCRAYNAARNIPDSDAVRLFRGCGSADHLKQAMDAVSAELATARTALLVGCGDGLAGRSGNLIPEIVGGLKRWGVGPISTLDPAVADLAEGLPKLESQIPAPVDAVISHSFLHFLYDPAFYLETIANYISPGGVLILAHEPNKRHFAARTFTEDPSTKRLPTVIRLLKRAVLRQPLPLDLQVNKVLRRQIGLQRDLTLEEIHAIVDPYMPGNPLHHVLGGAGFDWDEITHEYLPGFRLLWVKTYGNNAGGPELGASFTAVWKAGAR